MATSVPLKAELDGRIERAKSAPAGASRAEALLDLAEFSWKSGALSQARVSAIEALEQAVAADQASLIARSHLLRAECELKQSGPAAAEVYLRKAGKLPQVHRLIRGVGSRIALATGDAEEAEDLLSMEEPEDGVSAATLCHARIALLKLDAAEATMREARGRFRSLPERLHLEAAGVRLYGTWARPREAQEFREAALASLREVEAAVGPIEDSEIVSAIAEYAEDTPEAGSRSRWLRPFVEVTRRLNRPIPSERLLSYLLDVTIFGTGASRGVLRVYGPPEITAARSADGRSMTEPERHISQHLLEQVTRTGAVFATDDVARNPELRDFDSIRAGAVRSVLCLPLRVRARSIGVLYLDHRERPLGFGQGERGIAAAAAGEIALLADNAALYSASIRDDVTGLVNRPHFERCAEEEVARSRRYGENLSVLLVDVDRFKLVNDTHGHEVGNRVLRAVAQFLQKQSTGSGRRAPTVARSGRDEFGILFPSCDTSALAKRAAALFESLRAFAFEEGKIRLSLTASLGGATWPEEASSTQELLLRAESALAQAKFEGGDRFRVPSSVETVSDPEMDSVMLSRPGRLVNSMLGRVLEQTGDVHTALQTALSLMVRATGASAGTLALFDPGSEVRFAASTGDSPSLGAIRKVLDTDRPLRIERCGEDAWARGQESVRTLGIRTLVVVPIRTSERRIGAAYLDHRSTERRFTDEDLALLELFSRRVALLLQRTAEAEVQSRRAERLERAVEESVARLRARSGFSQILGRSPRMQELYSFLEKAAKLDYPVLFEGETGTGKELAARAIHFESPRKEQPFLPINCASVAESVLESELFGHAKGAFTGATTRRAGLFEAAGGGTLFLDEIEAMTPAMQTKLLRVLEDRKVRPVGANEEITIDVRIVAATNVSLKDPIAKGGFREDLYYRLATLVATIPPLRERIDDIPLLAERFLLEISEETRTPVKRLSPEAVRRLVDFAWPGNVRELKNVLRRLALVTETEIREEHLPDAIRGPRIAPVVGSWREQIESAERQILSRALGENRGNVRQTARALRMARSTLIEKMKRYGISGETD